MPLEMLGKYERLDVLGHGASGIVYLAKDTLLGKQVALKEISAQGEDKHRFLEEARVLDRLRHPNIVQVNSVDEIGGKVVIDMEYVRGNNLQEILRSTPQLPLTQAIDIAAQTCEGLAYAHSRRTVHRDIKPANILLTREGVVKIVDFGLAEVLGTHSFAAGAGTYAYMAPEDFHPEEQSDRQSDIWSVGVVLYEMLAGRRPFQVAKSKDPFAWKMAVEADPIIPLRSLRPDVTPELEAIVCRALSRDKAARYHDAGEMVSDLRPLVPSAPVVQVAPHQTLRPVLTGFPSDLTDIDRFLQLAPDHWNAARDNLIGGGLATWLRAIGEEPLAAVATEVATEEGREDDDKLRDFLYRAGLDTADEAQLAYADGQKLAKSGQVSKAIPNLRRAVHLDPSRPEYPQELASALRITGDFSGAALVLDEALRTHPTQRKLVREHADLAGATVVLSADHIDFGVLRRGQSRSFKLTLQHAGSGLLEGRVSAAPGWVRVEPPAFSTRRRQTLTFSAVTEGIWSTPASYAENVILETTGGRQEIAVSASILPARLSWGSLAFWYLPLLTCAVLPALAGKFSHHALAGFIASCLLCLSAFVLALAAEIEWRPCFLPLDLAVLNGYLAVQSLARFSASAGTAAHMKVIQTEAPILALLILQTCAFAFDSHGWGRWQHWRWIIAATSLLVAYSLR